MDTNNNSGAMNGQAFCTKCGKMINAGATFCPFCGQPQGAGNPTVSSTVQAQQTQQSQDTSGYNGPVTVNNYGYVPQEMTVGRWLLTMFITGIPVVGFIMLIVWALSSSPDNRSRKNWAIATFVWSLVLVAIAAVFGGSLVTLFLGVLSSR